MSYERTFIEWHDQPLGDILGLCRDVVEEVDYSAVQRWRARGGKTVGHFQVYFPQEIVHAAGLLPVHIRGAQLDPTNSDSHFGSYLCSILKTSLELALSGRVVLDAFVTHPICDAARNLAAIWGRNYDYPCQILYLPQNANSSATVQYLRDEYDRLLEVVEGVAGRKVSADDLRHSIGLYNRARALMRELYTLKRETPWKVAAEDAYALVSVGGMIPVEDHVELLEHVLPQLRERDAKVEDRIRVVFEGGFCEQPPMDLIRMVGRTCYIVDDDFHIGLRWVLEDIPTEGDDPLWALAHAYIESSSYSPVQHDERKHKEDMLVQRMEGCSAGAVVLAAAKMCEPGLEEQVAYIQRLDELGTPHFVNEFEENMSSFSALEMQVETFVENLLFD
ncbi:MAG TPA: 2-hydroxyacyl-CoA dehydratase [Myxococcota bacterium]|nr:2-hydroxyacyl-CoA dehydratase [Myxococcota bacterium]